MQGYRAFGVIPLLLLCALAGCPAGPTAVTPAAGDAAGEKKSGKPRVRASATPKPAPAGTTKPPSASPTARPTGGASPSASASPATPLASPAASTSPAASASPAVPSASPSASASPGAASVGEVTTYAGSTVGDADGDRLAAKFEGPYGLAFDASGNLFVSDVSNRNIRKIAPSGEVTTFVKRSSTFGTVFLRDLAMDKGGNLFVTDANAHRIFKVTPAGEMSVFAGGALGSADGTGAAAQFNKPDGLAIDAADNLYVADTENHRIRKVTPAGEVTTLAGSAAGSADGQGTAAQFHTPQDIALATDGNLYVADSDNRSIRKVTPGGAVTTFHVLKTPFASPVGLAIGPSGHVYALSHFQLHKIAPDGTLVTLNAAGGGTGYQDGPLSQAIFINPRRIVFDAAGDLYISDHNGNTAGTRCGIRKVSGKP